MAFKRNIDRLPIPPANAKKHNVVCHYCIVGCGYHAYTWPANKQGGTGPDENAFGVDLAVQQPAESEAWYAPSMYNLVKQDGKDVHLVIKPDHACEVNSGLASPRGGRMAEMSYSEQRNTELQRLTDPLVWRYGQLQPTAWDDALDLVARVTVATIAEYGEDGLFVSAADHGGAGGGYEFTWGTGKLYFDAMKIRNIRIHNRPAYNSEVHATRDMGIGELNNCYEDAELADTIFVVGANPLEAQTNYFLNHWVPNLRGMSGGKKTEQLPDEPHAPGRIVFVDPRRTVSVNASELVAGASNVLHLAVNPGTDMVLFNALFTLVADKGWVDQAFIDAHTAEASRTQGAPELPRKPSTKGEVAELTDFRRALEANRTTLERAAEITGLSPEDIEKAAAWIAEPKEGGARRRTMFAYEKGLIWGNDNYRTNGALVNLALATGNIGRPGGGCVRLGGHQEGYVRPSDGFIGRPAPYVDRLLIEGQGGVHHVWACDHYKTTLNAFEFKRVYKERTDKVKDAMSSVPYGDREAMVEAIMGAIRDGGLFVADVDIVPTKIGEAAHVVLDDGGEPRLGFLGLGQRQRFHRAAQRRQRVLQLVGDVGSEALDRLDPVIERIGHVANGGGQIADFILSCREIRNFFADADASAHPLRRVGQPVERIGYRACEQERKENIDGRRNDEHAKNRYAFRTDYLVDIAGLGRQQQYTEHGAKPLHRNRDGNDEFALVGRADHRAASACQRGQHLRIKRSVSARLLLVDRQIGPLNQPVQKGHQAIGDMQRLIVEGRKFVSQNLSAGIKML